MTLRTLAAGLLAGLAVGLPGSGVLAQTNELAPNLNPPAEAPPPCNPACNVGFACRAGVCEPVVAPTTPENAASSPGIAQPVAPQPAGTVVSGGEPPGNPGAVPEPLPGDENLLPPWIHTSDFVDTRLSFLFADSNLLAKPSETTPNSPGPGFFSGGQTNQFNQFYDNFNTRYTGFETLSNLVLYKKSKSFFKGLTAEAALALTVLVIAEKNGPQSQSTAIQDASSYIRLNWTPAGWNEGKEGISLTTFPLSADRMRLGYAYKISWGGSAMFPNQGNSVPGAKLQLNKELSHGDWFKSMYAYAGVKTTLIENAQIHEQETNYGFLGGVGLDIHKDLRLEFNGGYFQKGVNPEPQVLGVPVNSRGIAGELVYHHGEPIGYSVDFALYKNDPNHYINFFKPESYPGGLAYTISLEGDYLQQTLADPDTYGATRTQNATAAALQARFKYDFFRFGLLGEYRTLSYIQFNAPGFPPFYDFPQSASESAEAFFAVSGDYYIPSAHLTLGAIGGLQRPASFTSADRFGGNNPGDEFSGSRTVVVTDVNTFSILPTNATATNVLSAKVSARLDISEYVAAVGQVYYTRDNNLTTFKSNVVGVSEPSFQKPDILGFNVLLQARF